MARSALLIAVLLGLGGCSDPGPPAAPATAPAAPVPDRGPLVAFLGDSIASGLHLPRDAAFPVLLRDRLRAAGHPIRLVNAGVSGDTTAGGLARVDWILKQKPRLVVIELGGNDGLRPLRHLA